MRRIERMLEQLQLPCALELQKTGWKRHALRLPTRAARASTTAFWGAAI